MAKILLIEDDAGLCRMIKDWLALEQHQVEIAENGREGLEALEYYKYDLVVLDWNLPEIDGIEVLRRYRDKKGDAPVLMLTGRGEIGEKEQGFDTGADDYLTKPFHMKELSARIRAILRRPVTLVSDTIEIGALKIEEGTRKVILNGGEIDLLPSEYALLEFLMRHPNQVFSKDALLDRVWSSQSDATSNALTTCIKRLRKKLPADLIKTVYGVGYKLEAPAIN